MRPAAQTVEYHLRRGLYFVRQVPAAESPQAALALARQEFVAAQPDLEAVGTFFDIFQPLRPIWRAIPYAGDRLDSSLQLWQTLRYGLRVAVNASDLVGDVLEPGEGQANPNLLPRALAWVYQHQTRTHHLVQDLHSMRQALASVRPTSLPPEFRAEFQTYAPLVAEIDDPLIALDPHLTGLLGALGFNGPRVYLVLLQNDLELRPTGGFIGEYAVAEVELGDLVKLDIADSYDFPSAKTESLGPLPSAPPLHDYYGEPFLAFRDINWSPDFPTDAENASAYFRNEYEYPPDGVIAINLGVAQHLLQVIGPVDIPGSEVPLTSLNFYERYLYIRSSNENYKVLLAEIAKSVLDRTKATGATQLPPLIRAIRQGLQEKEVLIHFHQQDLQKWIHAQNWDGAIREENPAGVAGEDYLAVNDANVSGDKSSSLVRNQTRADLLFDDSAVHTTLVITTTNFAPSTQRIYRRIYLPARAQVESIDLQLSYGDEIIGQAQARWENNRVITQTLSDPGGYMFSQLKRSVWAIGDVTKELDKNVVSFVVLVARPSLDALDPNATSPLTPQRGGVTVLRLAYTLPQGLTKRDGESEYHLVVQKQPGAEPIALTLNIIPPRTLKLFSFTSPTRESDLAQFNLVHDEEFIARFR